ncbi:MAG: DUF389 domain-containing protein [Candidatus Uhrbacteria bacterium]
MAITIFQSVNEQDKQAAVEKLITASTPRQDFFLMIVLAVAMATLGLLMDSAAVVIGSMLIAPILYPILGLAMGVVMSDARLIRRSFATVLKSGILAIGAGAIITLLAAPVGYSITADTAALMEPSLMFAAVAVIAGLAASFALAKRQLSESLPGVAISVALIPPLASIGIGLARFDGALMVRAFLLFLLNAVGIVFAGMVVYSLLNLSLKRQIADRVIEDEDRAVQREQDGNTAE